MANVLITGANRGIGLELTRLYAEGGDTVFAFCRSPQSANQLNELAERASGRVRVHAMDVGDESSIKAAAGAVGDRPIDILINNAGIRGGNNQTLEKTDTADWIEAFKVMTIGPFRVVQAFLNNLRAAGNPRIATITSQLAATTWPTGGDYSYASTKAAVNRVMLGVAHDLKDQVIVAVIHPGWVKTDMGGPDADITPQESAAGVRNVIASLTMEDSGKFYKWNGDIHPW
ncbi:MAG TPA: SDR family oxidoreductase [Rhizomicrobium sp.]|jgi:NAD(P)-dependent dehydrogenase (short-subunit alcohol dehydrogenase family)